MPKLKAVDAEEGDGSNLPAYMRAGMRKEGGEMDDELEALGNGDLEVPQSDLT